MAFTCDYSVQEPTRADVDALSGLVLVEFGAPWCPHCQVVQATLNAQLERVPHIQHIKIYDGRGKPLGRSFRVKLWPTLVFIRDGEVLARLVRPGGDEIAASVDSLRER